MAVISWLAFLLTRMSHQPDTARKPSLGNLIATKME